MADNDIVYKNDKIHDGMQTEAKFPYTAASRWDKVKDELITKPKLIESDSNTPNNSKWNTLRKLISSTPTNAKSFLGVDDGKTVNHWNERKFRVINRNVIFGGRIKETSVKQYIDNVSKQTHVEQTDPFLMYALVGNKMKVNQNTSVANLAYDHVRNVFNRKKTIRQQQDNRQISDKDIEYAYGVRSAYSVRDDADQYVNNEDENNDVDNVEGPMDAFTNFDKPRKLGLGFCDLLCDNFISESKKMQYQDLLNSIKEHRPYFTYWITFVQIVICFVSIFSHGFAPFGFSYTEVKGLATTINLEKQFISYQVKQNFWIGPSVADLVHLGAKYAPCMRNDSNIFKAIQTDREIERSTACCIRNDRGGCVQTTRDECSQLMSNWHKWHNQTTPMGQYGSVCGLDPNFCTDNSIKPWEADITTWPICEKPALNIPRTAENEHMYCEVIGRPCCVGIQGECMITTREHCSLRRGHFHDTANLCSQVDCMQGICGMVEFLNDKNPDQVYRLFTSLFIHAGIIQLLCTILFQIFILRDVEKLAGCLRVSIIYIGSGIIGNLASSIFLPYQAEVGPSGSQAGILACVFIEMYHARAIYEKPWLVFAKILSCLLCLFVLGFLPMIDNYANVFGFLSGLCLSAILFPNINLNGDYLKRVIIIVVGILVLLALTATLIVTFYIKPIDKCEWCKIFSCPFPSSICLNMDFNIVRVRSSLRNL